MSSGSLRHGSGVKRKRSVPLLALWLALAVIAGPVVGCGSSSHSSDASGTTAATTTPTHSTTGAAAKPSCGSSSASAASSEAASTAAGDIPDNQQFLTFRNRSGGYSISYPEGWARSGNGDAVTFQDKSNTITIKVAQGTKPTTASVAAELKRERTSDPCLNAGSPQATTAGPNQVIKATYRTQGQKSPVTGQWPRITVDRYVYFKGGRVATVDLATPVGVDNVDAYRMISESFRWS
jgi:hypothetical protein